MTEYPLAHPISRTRSPSTRYGKSSRISISMTLRSDQDTAGDWPCSTACCAQYPRIWSRLNLSSLIVLNLVLGCEGEHQRVLPDARSATGRLGGWLGGQPAGPASVERGRSLAHHVLPRTT